MLTGVGKCYTAKYILYQKESAYLQWKITDSFSIYLRCNIAITDESTDL